MSNEEKNPYARVRISRKAIDTAVFILSLSLVIAISVAVLLSAKA